MHQSVIKAGSSLARWATVSIAFGALSLPSLAESLVGLGLGTTVVTQYATCRFPQPVRLGSLFSNSFKRSHHV